LDYIAEKGAEPFRALKDIAGKNAFKLVADS
jgi:hypothetical protein